MFLVSLTKPLNYKVMQKEGWARSKGRQMKENKADNGEKQNKGIEIEIL